MFLSAAQPLDIYTPGFVPTVIAYVCDWSPVLLNLGVHTCREALTTAVRVTLHPVS